ncbi:F-box protein [Abeliophyllum distichum]|uniref:F-box protein n=1 Tax=Abeliophyllum distichum TaxID=126358 RepID=A0ABD1NXW6_9LAMI
MMKLKNNEATDEGDSFSRLPDEVLISIFTKLSDLTSLFQCSLVCKRFASTMSHIQSIALTDLPSSEVGSFQSHKNECKLFQEILCISSEEIPRYIQSLSIQKLNFIIFLQKFKKLESIYLEFSCPRNISNSPFLKWKAKFASTRVEFQSFVSLLAASLRKETASACELVEEQENQEISREFLEELHDGYELSLMQCREWVYILCLLIKCHHSLKSVTVTNFENQGKLVLRDEQLNMWRNSLLKEETLDLEVSNVMNIASVPLLLLPSSGYVMKDVFLVIVKSPAESHDDVGEEDIITSDFEEEDKVLGEAVKEILMNHRISKIDFT